MWFKTSDGGYINLSRITLVSPRFAEELGSVSRSLWSDVEDEITTVWDENVERLERILDAACGEVNRDK